MDNYRGDNGASDVAYYRLLSSAAAARHVAIKKRKNRPHGRHRHAFKRSNSAHIVECQNSLKCILIVKNVSVMFIEIEITNSKLQSHFSVGNNRLLKTINEILN